MDLNKEKWDAGSYSNFVQYLKSIAQNKYAEFSGKIIPGAENILGVSVPILRAMAKEIIKGDWTGFLIQSKDNTLEEVMIQGIIIGIANTEIEEVIKMTEDYLPKINNWAVCDCFCTSLKVVLKYKTGISLLPVQFKNHNTLSENIKPSPDTSIDHIEMLRKGVNIFQRVL